MNIVWHHTSHIVPCRFIASTAFVCSAGRATIAIEITRGINIKMGGKLRLLCHQYLPIEEKKKLKLRIEIGYAACLYMITFFLKGTPTFITKVTNVMIHTTSEKVTMIDKLTTFYHQYLPTQRKKKTHNDGCVASCLSL